MQRKTGRQGAGERKREDACASSLSNTGKPGLLFGRLVLDVLDEVVSKATDAVSEVKEKFTFDEVVDATVEDIKDEPTEE